MSKKPSIDVKKIYATTKEILDILATGGGIAIIAVVTPLAIQYALPEITLELVNELLQKYDQRRLRRTINEMIKREMIALHEEDKETTIIVTEKGKRQLLKYNIQKMKLEKPKHWDGKWRVVIFDVKEGKKVLRNALRTKMQQLEFYQLQKSVYVSPYPCEKEISFIRQYYLVGDEVTYFLATNLEQEDLLTAKFSLNK